MRSWSSWVRFVILALVWGSSFLWIKIALDAFTPVQLALARLALGAVTLTVLCVATRTRLPRDRRTWLRIGLPALLGNAVPFILFGIGERTVSSPTGTKLLDQATGRFCSRSVTNSIVGSISSVLTNWRNSLRFSGSLTTSAYAL